MRLARPAALLLSAFVAACGDSSSAPGSQAAPRTPADAAANAAAGMTSPHGTPAMREITEDELDRYLATVKDLRAMGQTAKAAGSRNASDLAGMFQGMQDVAQFNAVLDKHGFDQPVFLTVHYSAVMSYSAVLLDEQQPEMDKSRAEQEAAFEQMKGVMSAEQIAAMKQQLGMANQQLESMRDVPPANKSLLAAHRKEFEAAIGKE